MDIKYTVQTETSRIQRNGSGGRTDQTAGQYRNGLEIGREEKNIYQGVTGSMYRKKEEDGQNMPTLC